MHRYWHSKACKFKLEHISPLCSGFCNFNSNCWSCSFILQSSCFSTIFSPLRTAKRGSKGVTRFFLSLFLSAALLALSWIPREPNNIVLSAITLYYRYNGVSPGTRYTQFQWSSTSYSTWSNSRGMTIWRGLTNTLRSTPWSMAVLLDPALPIFRPCFLSSIYFL